MKPVFLPVVGLVLVLAGCGDKAVEAPKAASAVQTVGAAPFETLKSFPEREAPATVLGKNEARLAAEIAARIIALPADAGDRVSKGQVLVRLDPRDAELALARASAALAQAQARLDQGNGQLARARSLREKNFISSEALTLRETDVLLAQADLKAAQATRDSAAHVLDKCSLRAPFDAIVRSRAGHVGEIANPGAPLLSLVDVSDLQLVAQVQARDAASLMLAEKVEFVLAGARHEVKKLRVSDAIHREARTVESRFAFVAPPPPPGSEGRLAWRDSRPHLAADLIVRRADKYGVFVVEAGKARFVAVEGAQEGRPAAVDLPATALVVQQGRHALQDGMAIELQAAKN